jgi:hypothetical protein
LRSIYYPNDLNLRMKGVYDNLHYHCLPFKVSYIIVDFGFQLVRSRQGFQFECDLESGLKVKRANTCIAMAFDDC